MKGKIYTIGIGHSPAHITNEIKTILKSVNMVAGFSGFIDMYKCHLGKDVLLIDDNVTRDISHDFIESQQNRVAAIVNQALKGNQIAVFSGGDSGIWGTAGFFIEAQAAHNNSFDIEIIPGIPGFIACAAKVGAPLMNGFSLISIGDEDTPFDIVKQRLSGIAQSGLPIVLYKVLLESANSPEYYPADKYPELSPPLEKTADRLQITYEVLSHHIKPNTPMAIITDVYSQTSYHNDIIHLLGSDYGHELIKITTFDQFLPLKDEYRFFTTIIIGDETTKINWPHMYTSQWNYNWKYKTEFINKIQNLDIIKQL